MNNNYSSLETFNLGKHEYVILRNDSKILYFEVVDGKYVMPIVSFSLFDNEGKSLTSVNQHYFMSELVLKLNESYKKGYLSNDLELKDCLKNIKSGIENDDELKKLFKGSFMKEINETNFENNKLNLKNYLAKFKFNSFVNYNNVSIFDGSLEKKTVNNENNAINDVDIIDDINYDVDLVDVNDVTVQSNVEIVQSNDYFSSLKDATNNTQDNDYFSSLNEVTNNTQSNDYFNSLNEVTNNVQSNLNKLNNDVKEDVSSNVDALKTDLFDDFLSNSSEASSSNLNSSPLSYLDEVRNRISNSSRVANENANMSNDNGMTDVFSNVVSDSSNENFNGNTSLGTINNDLNVNVNNDIVSNGINNNTADNMIDNSFLNNNANSNVMNVANNSNIVGDTNSNVTNIVNTPKEVNKDIDALKSQGKEKTKNHISGKVVAFIIFLIVVLCLFAYVLYNFVF